MINVLINGINGKMGQEVLKLIDKNNSFCVLCGVDASSSNTRSFPVYNNISEIEQIPDVIIDFSIPKATLKILEYAKSHNVPTVIATTGFSDEELDIIKQYSNNIPVFKSANMSYEINLMLDIVSKLAKQLTDSDIEIVETHHNKKIDSPSRNCSYVS